MSRYILEFKDGGGYVSLNRRYWPHEVERVSDPLNADRWNSRIAALEDIGGVFKQSRSSYVTRKLEVSVHV